MFSLIVGPKKVIVITTFFVTFCGATMQCVDVDLSEVCC